jgi:transcriptional regulator with XRE-family HTH domain
MKSSTLNTPMFNLLNMEKDFSTLSKRIAWRMQECKIKNGATLARLTSVSRGTASLWLNGTTHEIEGPNLTKLAKVLKCSAHWLQTGEGNWFSGIEGIQAPDLKTAQNVVKYERDGEPFIDPKTTRLMYYFKGLTVDHQQDLIAQAEAWFLRDNPGSKPLLPDEESHPVKKTRMKN